MGCAASSSGGPYYGNDVGPDGPLEAAPSNLLISGHPDAMYNGLFTRGTVAWNAKAMYSKRATGGRLKLLVVDWLA